MLSESQLQRLSERKQIFPVRFANSLWLLDSRAAVYWPEQDCLLIADLHFEKGSYLSQYASPVPRYDSKATLAVISSLLATYAPKQVICMGDSFHDSGAFERLLGDDRKQLLRMINQVERWVWLVGNHDPAIPDDLNGECLETVLLSTASGHTVKCQHIPDSSSALQITGHFHPKANLVVPGRRLRGKALVLTEQLMLLPALGQYTGGLNVDDEVILALAPKRRRQCYLLCEQRVIALPKGS